LLSCSTGLGISEQEECGKLIGISAGILNDEGLLTVATSGNSYLF
jgi:hypothetical protein